MRRKTWPAFFHSHTADCYTTLHYATLHYITLHCFCLPTQGYPCHPLPSLQPPPPNHPCYAAYFSSLVLPNGAIPSIPKGILHITEPGSISTQRSRPAAQNSTQSNLSHLHFPCGSPPQRILGFCRSLPILTIPPPESNDHTPLQEAASSITFIKSQLLPRTGLGSLALLPPRLNAGCILYSQGPNQDPPLGLIGRLGIYTTSVSHPIPIQIRTKHKRRHGGYSHASIARKCIHLMQTPHPWPE